MENKIVNIRMVAEIGHALKELRKKVVFVGGAVISLYTDDPSADEVRPSDDIDLTIQLTGYAEWAKMQQRIAQLGFTPNPEGHAICSYLYNKIMVDIIPSENPYYEENILAQIHPILINDRFPLILGKVKAIIS